MTKESMKLADWFSYLKPELRNRKGLSDAIIWATADCKLARGIGFDRPFQFAIGICLKALHSLTPSYFGVQVKTCLIACATTLIVVGCGSTKEDAAHLRVDDAFNMPVLLSNPAIILLTNTDSFTARTEVVENGQAKKGRVYGREGRIFYAADPLGGSVSKRRPGDRTSFIWDVADAKGYVVNDALQGYAPIFAAVSQKEFTVSYTNNGSIFEDIDGHRCRRMEAVFSASDGSSLQYSVWRAGDLKGFPLRIKGGRLTINFSKVKLDPLPMEVFLPPDGYTKHPNPELMMAELLSRQVNSKIKVSSDLLDRGYNPNNMRDNQRPNSGYGPQ